MFDLKYFRAVCNIYVIFLLYGSAFLSFIPTLIGIPPAIPLYFNYAVNILLSLFIIFVGNYLKTFSVSYKFIFPLFLFLIVYVLRLIDNLYVLDIFTVTFPNPSTYFLYLFVLNVIPCVGLCFCSNIDFTYVFKWGYRILFIVLLMSLWYNLFSNIEKTSNLRNTGNDIIGALSYGHYGVTFSILSLVKMNSSSSKNKYVFVLGYLFGLFVMYLSGSRSPLIALVICTVLYLFGSNGLFKGAFILILLVFPLYLLWDEIFLFLSSFHSGFIQRLLMSFESGDTSGRDVIYSDMWKQIWEDPLLGRYFVVYSGEYAGYYPHNMILEALGATGILIGMFFIYWLVRMIMGAVKIISWKDKRCWVSLVFLQYMIFGMSSKALYTNTYFWYFVTLQMVILFSFNTKKNPSHESHI